MMRSRQRLLTLICVYLLGGCGEQSTINPPQLHGARLAVAIEDVALVPASSSTPPRARINYLYPAPDSSRRLFVNDMMGSIYVIQNGELRREPFLDIAAARKGRFTSDNLFEQGLNTFAFHPDFAQPGRPGSRKLYTLSTEIRGNAPPTFAHPVPMTKSAHDDVILEWSADPKNENRIDPSTAREVMRIAHPRHDHVGGQLGFNPNARPSEPDYGKLYIAIGDGGNTVSRNNQVDEWRIAQNKGLPLGKILRIDPVANGEKPYSIPKDNPFVGDPRVLPEIWAYGLRNPQRFSWDTGGDHKMLISDIGQSQLEEINVGQAGANYGWSQREGTRMVSHEDAARKLGLPFLDFIFRFTYPALVYGHHLGLAITGGFVYRGEAMPQLRGMYVFGDIVSGRIFFADVQTLQNGTQAPFYELPLHYRGTPRTLKQIVNAARADLRFGLDDRGEIYVLTKQDGMVRRLAGLVPAESSIFPVEYPIDLLETRSLWDSILGRIEATAQDLIRRR